METGSQADWKTTARTAALVFVLGAGVLFLVGSRLMQDSGGSAVEQQRADAYGACTGYVSDRLKAPSTARFSGLTETAVDGYAPTFTVRGWVDSENGFGANVRSDFRCVVEYRPGGWAPVEVEVDSR